MIYCLSPREVPRVEPEEFSEKPVSSPVLAPAIRRKLFLQQQVFEDNWLCRFSKEVEDEGHIVSRDCEA